MILVDFSGTIFAAIHVDLAQGGQVNKEYIRHIVLNSLRMYNKTYRDEYGEMHINLDSKSWRNDVYPLYKWVRNQDRNSDDNDWSQIFDFIVEIQDEIREFMPWPVIQGFGAEADDSIAYMAQNSKEPTLIISNDKDLVKLTEQDNVDMVRPYDKGKGLYTVKDPARFEFDLIMSGDKDDGVPSIRCADDFFKEQYLLKAKKDAGETDEDGNEIKVNRAPPVTVKSKNVWYEAFLKGEESLKVILKEEAYKKDFKKEATEKGVSEESLKEEFGDELFKRYLRNKQLISLNEIPDDVQYEIRKSIKKAKPAGIMKALGFLTAKRMNNLAKEIGDFKVNKTPRKTTSLFDL